MSKYVASFTFAGEHWLRVRGSLAARGGGYYRIAYESMEGSLEALRALQDTVDSMTVAGGKANALMVPEAIVEEANLTLDGEEVEWPSLT